MTSDSVLAFTLYFVLRKIYHGQGSACENKTSLMVRQALLRCDFFETKLILCSI